MGVVLVLSACGNVFRPSPERIAKRISSSLVRIETRDPDGRPVSAGSGFFYADTGRVVTNLHVMERASQAVVRTLNQDAEFPVAGVYAVDLRHDLCVLSIKGDQNRGLRRSDRRPQVGEDVYAGGSPLGLEGTISKGVVTALRPTAGMIQVDVAISPGSSGGPVVNGHGELIGVATSSLAAGQSLNFAVDARFIDSAVQINCSVLGAGVLAFRDVKQYEFRGPVRWAKEVRNDDESNSVTTYWFDELGNLTRMIETQSFADPTINTMASGTTTKSKEYDSDGFKSA
jgi:hypothetical protein